MNTKNFTTEELQNYFNKGLIYFFKFRSCYILKHDIKKGFYFSLDKTRSKKSGLPHTKRGYFHAFTELDSYTICTGLKPPEKIKIDKFLNRKILNNNLKAIDLVIKLNRYGFESKKEDNKTALKDLNFKGVYLKNVVIQNDFLILSY